MSVALVKKRIQWADMLRVVATVMVIGIHVVGLYREFYFNNHRTLQFLVIDTVDSIFRFAVPVFFMLTGAFVLTRKIHDIKSFYRKAFFRIFVPFTVFSLATWIYYASLDGNWSIIDMLIKFTNNPGLSYQMWFVYVILTFYLFIPILQRMVGALSRKMLRTLIILIVAMGSVLGTINIVSSNLGVELFRGVVLPDVLCYLNYLFIGYYIAKYGIAKRVRLLLYMLGIASVFFIPVVSLTADNFDQLEDVSARSSVFALLIGVSIYTFFKYTVGKVRLKGKVTAMLQSLSSASFYIYLIHVVVMDIIRQLLGWGNADIGLTVALPRLAVLMILTFIVSAIISLAFDAAYRYFRRRRGV